MDDSEIVDLFWRRDENAILETEAKYANYCFHISFIILRSQEDAEECVNDTYLHAWNAIPPHRPGRLSTFLGKITRNLSLQRYLKIHAQKRGAGQADVALQELEECIAGGQEMEQMTDEIVVTEILNAFLRALQRESRVVFVARYWYLYSIPEIARQYRMSESKVKSILFRTRKKLKNRLETEGIEL